jgi:twinkle protein
METIREDDIDWAAYAEESELYAKVISGHEVMPDVTKYLHGNYYKRGAKLPWDKTHDKVQLRLGEVSVYAGVNGHGKSLLTGQVVLALVQQNFKTLVASFEMPVGATLGRMARQATNIRHPDENMLSKFSMFMENKLYVFDHHGRFDGSKIEALCRYAKQEKGIEHIVIDSLMKVVKGEDDYNGQKDLINSLCAIAQRNKIHIHLVHHLRKTGDEFAVGGKFDLKGSGAISDQVDNIFIVWKNKKKEMMAQQGEAVDNSEPDAMLICEKQRHGEFEGRFLLWFDRESQQFVEMAHALPYRYLI